MVAYADRAQLYIHGISADRAAAAERKSPGCVDALLETKSRFVDSFLRTRYVLPLAAWGDEIAEATCHLVAIGVIGVLGKNPNGTDEWLFDRAKQTCDWLKDVAAKRAHPDVTEGGPEVDGAVVLEGVDRGWDGTVALEDRRGWCC